MMACFELLCWSIVSGFVSPQVLLRISFAGKNMKLQKTTALESGRGTKVALGARQKEEDAAETFLASVTDEKLAADAEKAGEAAVNFRERTYPRAMLEWEDDEDEETHAFPEVVEADGSPVESLEEAKFKNWGKTVKNRPFAVFYPTTKTGLQNAVKFATKHGKRVRCSAYKHSWSSVFSDDDEVLISLLPREVANTLPSIHAPLDPTNEFQFITPVGEAFTDPVDHKLKRHVKIGPAVTNEQFRSWVVESWKAKKEAGEPLTDLWTVPW